MYLNLSMINLWLNFKCHWQNHGDIKNPFIRNVTVLVSVKVNCQSLNIVSMRTHSDTNKRHTINAPKFWVGNLYQTYTKLSLSVYGGGGLRSTLIHYMYHGIYHMAGYSLNAGHHTWWSPAPPPFPLQTSDPPLLLLISGGHHGRLLQTCSLEGLHLPTVLTSSGGHQNTYSWQAGGTHPTGMPSCFMAAFCHVTFLVTDVW